MVDSTHVFRLIVKIVQLTVEVLMSTQKKDYAKRIIPV